MRNWGNLYREPSIRDVIKVQELRCLKHVERMPTYTMPKAMTVSKVGEKIPRGR